MTTSQSPTGAAQQLAYNNTAAATKYLPSGGSDDAGNASTYTYNGAGNQLTATDANAAQAKVSYNTDGTVASATAPANGSKATTYAYDSLHQLTSVAPVTGSSLGTRAFTYDGFGRTRTSTDGRGIMTTYTYDALDRVTTIHYSGGTGTIGDTTFTYDSAGRVATRDDATGTTTYGYDTLGRLTTRSATSGGGTLSYGYDKASNLTSVTDSRGTTTYDFDASGVVTGAHYAYNGTTNYLQFAVDDQGRRTDTWLGSTQNHTKWAAHTHTGYDTSGRVASVTADEGTGDTSYTRVVDLTYCYAAGATSPTCSATTSADRTKLVYVKDAANGDVTNYTYDTSGRLTKAVTTGNDPVTYTYTYDANGNRLTSSSGTTTANTTTTTNTFNTANQLTTAGNTYDGAGNLTASSAYSAITYNDADQMETVRRNSVDYSYEYAGTNQDELTHSEDAGGISYDLRYGRTDAQGAPVIECSYSAGGQGGW